jgi:hypothetical protein
VFLWKPRENVVDFLLKKHKVVPKSIFISKCGGSILTTHHDTQRLLNYSARVGQILEASVLPHPRLTFWRILPKKRPYLTEWRDILFFLHLYCLTYPFVYVFWNDRNSADDEFAGNKTFMDIHQNKDKKRKRTPEIKGETSNNNALGLMWCNYWCY